MSPRVVRSLALGVLLAVAILWWLLPRGVAELTVKQGLVERDHHQAPDRFERAPLGAVFVIGDGLRTGVNAHADVRLTQGPLLKVRAATLLRFRDSASGVAKLTLTRGELSIFTVEEPVLLETAAGLVRIAPRSRALLREHQGETWVDVVLGRAQLEWASTTRRELRDGESVHFDPLRREADFVRRHGSADHEEATTAEVSEHVAPDAGTLHKASPTPLPRAEPPLSNDTTMLGASAPSSDQPATAVALLPDLFVPAAPMLSFFDPAPPTQVGFATPRCKEGALPTLELERRGRSAQAPGLMHAFDPGLTHYRLRCGAKIMHTGLVRVVKDAGQRPLSALAPENQIEADGRAYTVLYQTRLPALRVRWTSARAPNQLVVESGGARRVFPGAGSVVDLPSGTLGEGAHKLWFEQPGSDARSRTTSLQIRFDNATPMARLADELESDGAISVSGAVVAGARVVIGDTDVPLDAAGRFRARVVPVPGVRGFAVRVELPGRSVVYYVRRFGSAGLPQ
jgi:hypothetical protein